MTLAGEYASHHQRGLIQDIALTKRHCFHIELDPEDYASILINSPADSRILSRAEYPTLREVIVQITSNNAFLETSRHDGGLCGVQVAHYLKKYRQNRFDEDRCFILDRDIFPDMNAKGKYYVIDGMHRLIAFGLAMNLEWQRFPVPVCYCTDRS